MTMPTTVFSMTLSSKSESSALHPGSQLLLTSISLLAPSTSTSTSLALHFSLHSAPSPLPSPLLHLLLLLGSPSEIQEFTIIIIFSPYWWLFCNKLFFLSFARPGIADEEKQHSHSVHTISSLTNAVWHGNEELGIVHFALFPAGNRTRPRLAILCANGMYAGYHIRLGALSECDHTGVVFIYAPLLSGL